MSYERYLRLAHSSQLTAPKRQCPAAHEEQPGIEGMAGDGLLSHHLSVAVPSTLRDLTSVFGMGTGVAPAR